MSISIFMTNTVDLIIQDHFKSAIKTVLENYAVLILLQKKKKEKLLT